MNVAICAALLFAMSDVLLTTAFGADVLDDIVVPLSTLSIDISVDSDHHLNQDLLLDYGFNGGYHAHANAGNSAMGQDGDAFTATHYSLGFTTNQAEDFSIALDYLYTGNRNDFNVNALGGSLSWNQASFSIVLSPTLRAISINTAPQILKNLVPEKILISSNVYNISFFYYGSPTVFFSAGYTRYDYSRDMAVFNDSRVSLFVSPEVGYLSASFDKSQGSITLGYSALWGNVSTTLIRAQSAIDESISNIVQIDAEKSLGLDWSLHGRLGASHNELADRPLNYYGFGLSYLW